MGDLKLYGSGPDKWQLYDVIADIGEKVDLSKAKSKTQAVDREYEVIKDSDKARGVLTSGSYLCPKCDCDQAYSYLEQTRSSDEPETRMLTCKECDHGWREY